jgi:hypothetical protein
MHPVDPRSGEIDEGGKVLLARQPFRLETRHLARRSRSTIQTARVHDRPHRRVERQPLGVVHVLVAGEAAEHRLAKQPPDQVPNDPAAPRLGQNRPGQVGQSERVIQFAIGEQAGVRGDLAAVEFQLQAAVEIDPQRPRIRLTHRVGHDRASNIFTRY